MTSISLWIPGPLPTLNELIDLRARWGRTASRGRRWNAYADIKRTYTQQIAALARARIKTPPSPPVIVDCVWYQPTLRLDPDNVAAGGLKVILDGLVVGGVLPGDGARIVAGIRHEFRYLRGHEQGVRVTLLQPGDLIEAWRPPLGAGHDERCYGLPDERELVWRCHRCGAMEAAEPGG